MRLTLLHAYSYFSRFNGHFLRIVFYQNVIYKDNYLIKKSVILLIW